MATCGCIGAPLASSGAATTLASDQINRPAASCSNLVKALPWFHTVREKLLDPAYSGFFLKFDATQKGNYSVPQCDNNYDPPICSDFCASPTLAAPCFRLPTF